MLVGTNGYKVNPFLESKSMMVRKSPLRPPFSLDISLVDEQTITEGNNYGGLFPVCIDF